MMESRNAWNPEDAKHYTTEKLRAEFLIESLFSEDTVKMVYSYCDRVIAGGAMPLGPVRLIAGNELRAEYFLERREMGIINIGAEGIVAVDGKDFELGSNDGLYIGKGARDIVFASSNPNAPAKFYFISTPAHMEYPAEKIEFKNTEPAKMGSSEEANSRIIYKYIHPAGVKSCQLVMGMTILKPGSVWNTMPCHTHDRRMEVYLYFNLPKDALVFHFMGEPGETRHIAVRNEEAVISPSWSVHSGCGTSNYTFIWGMAGENQVFSDQDLVPMKNLK